MDSEKLKEYANRAVAIRRNIRSSHGKFKNWSKWIDKKSRVHKLPGLKESSIDKLCYSLGHSEKLNEFEIQKRLETLEILEKLSKEYFGIYKHQDDKPGMKKYRLYFFYQFSKTPALGKAILALDKQSKKVTVTNVDDGYSPDYDGLYNSVHGDSLEIDLDSLYGNRSLHILVYSNNLEDDGMIKEKMWMSQLSITFHLNGEIIIKHPEESQT